VGRRGRAERVDGRTSGALRLLYGRRRSSADLFLYRLDERRVSTALRLDGGNLHACSERRCRRHGVTASLLDRDSTEHRSVLPFLGGERWTGVGSGRHRGESPADLERRRRTSGQGGREGVAFRFRRDRRPVPGSKRLLPGGALLAEPEWIQIMATPSPAVTGVRRREGSLRGAAVAS